MTKKFTPGYYRDPGEIPGLYGNPGLSLSNPGINVKIWIPGLRIGRNSRPDPVPIPERYYIAHSTSGPHSTSGRNVTIYTIKFLMIISCCNYSYSVKNRL